MTPEVMKLLADSGFPGMKPLQFAFGEGGEGFLPHNCAYDTICYIGTHDNPTLHQWLGLLTRKELAFICLSGIATGASWLCYYRALQEGPASVVVPIDKLSILVTTAFSYFVFGERLGRRAAAGLALLTAGTVAMAFL